jgi:chemotaxis protein methyltransferase CheR
MAFIESFSPLTDAEFSLFAALIYKLAGISLKDTKMSLVSNRLRKRLRALNLRSYREYYDYIASRGARAEEETVHFINAITTNETYFFRHEQDFELLKNVIIPEVEKRHAGLKKTLKVWSSASSTGEEPYSIAITVAEAVTDPQNWVIQIIASDINVEVLKQCEKGIYGPYAVSRLTPYAINKYFDKLKPETAHGEERYAVREEFKKMVRFKRHNLKEPFPLTKFDCIFCRNVLIYFDVESKTHVVENLYNSLTDGGYLILGHAESLMRIKSRFNYYRPSIYRR